MTEIGDGAFAYCRSLTSLTFENGATSLGSGMFYGAKWPEIKVIFQDGATSASFRVSVTDAVIPASVADISLKGVSTVYGAKGSYAEHWAAENGCAFEATLPPATTPARTAYAATQNIWVDGKAVEFQAYARKDANGNLTNYVKLRDVASVLNGTAAQFQVGWDGSKVTITTGTAYTPIGSEMTTPYSGDQYYASAGDDSVRFNGSSRSMNSLVLKDADGGGYTYYKLRDLGKLLNFNVSWSPQWGVYIETNKPYDSTT